MKNLFLFLFFALIANFTAAQILHDTGTLTVSALNTGYIGHGAGGAVGDGIKFNNSLDAMFTAGILIGNSSTGIIGNAGSFSTGGVYIVDDMISTSPFTSFTSNSNSNQIASIIYTDGNAPVPIGLTIHQSSHSNTNDDFVIFRYVIVNENSQALEDIYVGMFADWDVGLNNYAKNRGAVETTKNLIYQYEQGGAADPNYYGIVALNGLTGGRLSSTSPGENGPLRDTLVAWISSVQQSPATLSTDADYRSYLGSGPFDIPAGGHIVVGFAFLAGTDLADLTSNADLASAKWQDHVLPVELSSFTASAVNGKVQLNWETASEINNRGFEVQRKAADSEFKTLAFINGNGTTTEKNQYSFIDNDISRGNYVYRLKQVDFDGSFAYTEGVEIDFNGPAVFALGNNYPNPFNPSTKFNFSLDADGNVRLAVYDLLGQQVALLVNGFKQAGTHDVEFNASALPTGSYFYRLESAGKVLVKKMLLAK